MGGVQRRKKMHSGDTHMARRHRLRNRKKDLDEIDVDLKTQAVELVKQSVDLDKPGFAQFYCLHCAKYFIDNHALSEHFRTKVHKRRMKALELEPYSHEESARAAGQGNFVAPTKRKMETQPHEVDENKKDIKRAKIDQAYNAALRQIEAEQS